MTEFKDYRIHIVDAHNYPGQFVAYLEEFHNVQAIIDTQDKAEIVLSPLFDKEIKRLQEANETIPQPDSGKAKVTFASDDKIKALRPLVDDFWDKILGTSYSTSFVSDDSYFIDWEHYLSDGKNDIIAKVKTVYNMDIEPIYDRPIHEILTTIKNNNSFIGRLKRIIK
jgi:predicted RNase H-like HicB family nuclease